MALTASLSDAGGPYGSSAAVSVNLDSTLPFHMKRFVFKLQAVLVLRQRAEQAALENYTRTAQRQQALAAQLIEVEMELSEGRRQWLNALADGCPAVRAAQMMAFCHLLEARKGQAEQELMQANIDLYESSQQLVVVRQQRETVEKFMERQRARYDRELHEDERKMIDDLVGRRPSVSFSARSGRDNLWN
jgi:flagellar export protein FliJ